MKKIEEIKQAYNKEITKKPHSWAESLAHANKLTNLKKELSEAEADDRSKSTFDPLLGVKFTDEFGRVLPVTVEPSWVNQTKEGTTVLTYMVKDIDSQVHTFKRRVTVSKHQISAYGIENVEISYRD